MGIGFSLAILKKSPVLVYRYMQYGKLGIIL